MRITDAVLELLEFKRALYPFKENLRGELGELALLRCAPCGAFDQLERRRASADERRSPCSRQC